MAGFDSFNYPMLNVPGMGAGNPTIFNNDAAVSGGMAFLVGELEKRDERLREPLTSVDWPRDIPVESGGGFVDAITSFNVSYGSTGGTNDGLMQNESNELHDVQAAIDKYHIPYFIWGHIIRVPRIDQQKLQQVGRSLDSIFDKGLHLAHDKKLGENVYVGFTKQGTYGLVNSPNIVTVTAAPHTSGGTDTQWVNKTPDEILADFNRVLTGTIEASGYDRRGMANHILIPWAQYTDLVNRKVDEGSATSVLTYLQENNIANKQNIDLYIEPTQWCKGRGTNNTDRMVAYRNDKEMVKMDITVPLKRLFTQPSAAHIAYLTPYVTQFSCVQWLYTTHAMYVDGI